MDEVSNKNKEDTGYSEESKTLIINLIKFHFQSNAIRFTLTNILPVDEKSTKQINMM